MPPEIEFIAALGVAPHALQAAAQNSLGLEGAEQILLNDGAISAEDYYRALAAKLKVNYFTGEIPFVADIDPIPAVLKGVGLLAPNQAGIRAAVAPRGLAVRFLLEAVEKGRVGKTFAICSPQRLADLLRAQKGGDIADEASTGLSRRSEDFSARRGLTRRQIGGALFCAAAAAFCVFKGYGGLGIGVSICFWLIFALTVFVRLVAAVAQSGQTQPEPLSDRDLPIYTLIAPLYDEANGVARLVDAFDSLDYPKAKLDIKIVVERRDQKTLRALAELELPARYDIVVAPPGAPSTKPRALNIALPFARGDFVVVYDAEDLPDADQLRLAAARFVNDPSLDCQQARLVIDNPDETWVTKLFAIEYAVLFDLINPGLAALGAPIALGGTSNHFRASALREAGAWDAWNLTEDIDLGVRLAQLGHRVDFLASDTNEEAPLDLQTWFKQRTRWQKGWMQTLIVHSRHPIATFKRLGLRNFAFVVALVPGAVVTGLFGPFLFANVLWRLCRQEFIQIGAVQYLCEIMIHALLFAGVLAVAVPVCVALQRRNLSRLGLSATLLPLYYLLVSLATWAALVDLIFRPFYWSKTEHGQARMRAVSNGGAAASLAPPPNI